MRLNKSTMASSVKANTKSNHSKALIIGLILVIGILLLTIGVLVEKQGVASQQARDAAAQYRKCIDRANQSNTPPQSDYKSWLDSVDRDADIQHCDRQYQQ